MDSDEQYIVEYARTIWERFKEHLKVPSPSNDHANTKGHYISLSNFSVVGREAQNITRTIKELCTSGSKIHSSIGTFANYSYPTYGMRSCSIPLPFTSNIHPPHPIFPSHSALTCFCHLGGRGLQS